MNRDGVVSVWAGTVADEDALYAHVAIAYDDDATSAFRTETGIDWYDEDFAEGSVSADPATALREHSYGESFAAEAAADVPPGANALYLIYDFDAAGCGPGLLRLVGVYPFWR